MRGNSFQDIGFRKLPENRNETNLTRDLDMLSGELNLSISQAINSLLNGRISQRKNAIKSAISERTMPQMQGVIEMILRSPGDLGTQKVMKATWMKISYSIGNIVRAKIVTPQHVFTPLLFKHSFKKKRFLKFLILNKVV